MSMAAEEQANDCRVLLADDTPEIRLLVRRVLEVAGGFEVVGEAGDGEQAIALAGRMQPDVILLDLAMPVMDGLQAIPEIRRIAPESKIVVLTGFDENKVYEEAIRRGASAFLAKGVGPGEITETLRRVCALPDEAERVPH